jgi:hypothetical protein
MTKKPPLSLVEGDVAGVSPPFNLGRHGRSLWGRIQAEYDVSDSAGVEMLAQACAAADLAERLSEEVEHDGPVIRLRGVIRAHPAIKDLIGARAFVVRVLTKLGLNYEPVRASPGRPGVGHGWSGNDDGH